MYPGYAIAIVHYKAPQLIDKALSGINAQTVTPRRVVVIDNSGELDVGKVAALGRGFPTLVIKLPNPGYAGAVNRARAALNDDEEYLLVLTQEVVLLPGTVAAMLRTAMDRSAACVGPRLSYISAREKVFSYGGTLGLGGRAGHLRRPVNCRPYNVDWIDGAVMLLQLRALDDIGGFDECYFLYYEEVDLASRMRSAGYSVMVDPAATAYQEPGAYPPYLRFRNHILFARTRYSVYEIVGALLINVLRSLPGWLVRRKYSAPIWCARGIIDGFMKRGGKQPETPFACKVDK